MHRSIDSELRMLRRRLSRRTNSDFGRRTNSDSTCSRLVVPLAIWICVCMSLRYGYYGSSKLVLGPNSSRLLQASSLFVEQIQVKDESEKGLMLFGFSEKPQLSYKTVWNVTKALFIPTLHRQGFSMWLNQGSRIQARWNAADPEFAAGDPLIVLLRGEKNYRRWLRDPKKMLAVDSHHLTHGTGEMNYTVDVDDNYYIGAVNLYPRAVKATMTVEISSVVYNTSKAESKCSTKNGLCRLNLLFPNTRYAVLTTPTDWEGGDDGGWYVELSYAVRVGTYILIMGLFVVLIYLFLKYFGAVEHEGAAPEVRQSEISPLVIPKHTLKTLYGSDDDCESNVGSSSADLYDGKLCVVCYDEPRNCFFIPCGHCATCYSCARRLEGGDMKPCPICRRPIHKVRSLLS